MKKYLLLFLMMLLPMVASADRVKIDGLYYNLISKDNIAEVVNTPTIEERSELYAGDIIIPSVISYQGTDYKVVKIGDDAFHQSYNLKSVVIPNSVTAIGHHALSWCFNLISVDIPSSVTSIGSRVFDSSGLTSIDIPNSVTSIGSECFWKCESLSKINLSNSLSSIKASTFYHCTALTSIDIPNSVTTIESAAFYECTALTSIDIPNSVTTIGKRAFYGCSELESVSISTNLNEIADDTFYGCNITSITIPNSVKSIGNNAFSYCKKLKTITLGSGVNTIKSAFGNCKELEDVYCYMTTLNSNMLTSAFYDSFIEYATLHVPQNLIPLYSAVEPWSTFGSIVALTDDDPKPTGVDEVKIKKVDVEGTYYDLNGRKLTGTPTQKGVYINNGKKVVAK